MISKTVQTTDGSLTLNIPTSLYELTLEQMIELQESTTATEGQYLAILSGVPYETILNVRNAADLQAFTQAIMTLCNSIKYLYNEEAIPHSVIFTKGEYFLSVEKQEPKSFWQHLFSRPKANQVEVEVAKNLSVEPAGAYFNARDIIADEINLMIKKFGDDNWKQNMNPSLRSLGMILAHYFYERATGLVYEERKAEQFYDVIKRMSVADAVPIARYFFLKYPDLSKQKISFWQQVRQYSKRKQALKNLRSSSTSIR